MPNNIENEVEEFVSEFRQDCTNGALIRMENWLTERLTSLTEQHQREKEAIVREIREDVGDYNDGCGCCMTGTADAGIKQIATNHNIL